MKIYKLSTKFRLFIVFLCSTFILGLCLPTSFLKPCHVCCKLTWSSVCFSLSFIFTQICLCSISFLFPRKLTASHVSPPIVFEMRGKHTEMEKWFQTFLLENLEISQRWLLSSSWSSIVGEKRKQTGLTGSHFSFQLIHWISCKERFPQTSQSW